MKRFDSLEAYDTLTENGVPPLEARSIVRNLNLFWNYIMSDFFSNKKATYMIVILIAIGGLLSYQLNVVRNSSQKLLNDINSLRSEISEWKNDVSED